jgi:hypothetical protein
VSVFLSHVTSQAALCFAGYHFRNQSVNQPAVIWDFLTAGVGAIFGPRINKKGSYGGFVNG